MEINEKVSPDDQIDLAQFMHLVDSLEEWITNQSSFCTPQQVAGALLFCGGRVTEFHIMDRSKLKEFVDNYVDLGCEYAIECLKMYAIDKTSQKE